MLINAGVPEMQVVHVQQQDLDEIFRDRVLGNQSTHSHSACKPLKHLQMCWALWDWQRCCILWKVLLQSMCAACEFAASTLFGSIC